MPEEQETYGATAQGEEHWDALLAEYEEDAEAFASQHGAHVTDSVVRYKRWKEDVE